MVLVFEKANMNEKEAGNALFKNKVIFSLKSGMSVPFFAKKQSQFR